MTGYVDEALRALVRLRVAATGDAAGDEIEAWIDTAFNGGLVIPRATIESLGLVQESSTEAVLADGSVVQLETFGCHLQWFGRRFKTQVVANDGRYALLGTMLLDGRRVEVDYGAARTVRIA